jgi:hypothetical protein
MCKHACMSNGSAIPVPNKRACCASKCECASKFTRIEGSHVVVAVVVVTCQEPFRKSPIPKYHSHEPTWRPVQATCTWTSTRQES